MTYIGGNKCLVTHGWWRIGKGRLYHLLCGLELFRFASLAFSMSSAVILPTEEWFLVIGPCLSSKLACRVLVTIEQLWFSWGLAVCLRQKHCVSVPENWSTVQPPCAVPLKVYPLKLWRHNWHVHVCVEIRNICWPPVELLTNKIKNIF